MSIADPKVLIDASPPHLLESQILTKEALQFLTSLHLRFNNERLKLLLNRKEKQKQLDSGFLPTFLHETAPIRNNQDWKGAPPPPDLQRRWVEITGPTDAKMMINALNSGADVFMADFEDANAPTWGNLLEGQCNLGLSIDGTLNYESPEKKSYRLNEKTAVLFVRPRGWHLEERHVKIEGTFLSASLFDFGLYIFHNAKKLLTLGKAPYFYLPKMESHLEARLWNEIFFFSEDFLEIPRGTIRATVLIETILAAFEMEEILFELREHSAGLNAGRWDYLFSIIKKFNRSDLIFPDRGQLTMTTPFMLAYATKLVQVCHKRGVHAMGGMAAFIPSRKDEVINKQAIQKVKEDKTREVQLGFDGTWVAHPDLVPIAKEIFETALKGQPNQIDKLPSTIKITPQELLNFTIADAEITELGVRQNIRVALQYLEAWLNGQGAVAIENLMEDAATAEISRAQLWQWLHGKNVHLKTGTILDLELFQHLFDDELKKLEWGGKSYRKSAALLEKLVKSAEFIEFLTLEAYPELISKKQEDHNAIKH